MRLGELRLRGYKRFLDTEINLDAPVIAITGPNEAGKTSILRAIAEINQASPIDERDLTWEYDTTDVTLEAIFLPTLHDIHSIETDLPSAVNLRWVGLSKTAKGERTISTNTHMSPEAQSNIKQYLPEMLLFTESDRNLRSTYDLRPENADWNDAVQNLATLSGFTMSQLAEAAQNPRQEVLHGILRTANKRLDTIFEEAWSQSRVNVSLDVRHPLQLNIYVEADGGPPFRLEDRSDGLRMFVALIAFIRSKEIASPPIIMVDEAENHLHYDAQADLVQMFHHQVKDQANISQIIYSTHSPGCLPHDLGNGMRAVEIDPANPHHSTVVNRIWKSEAGYRPLLWRMGATTAALTPHRFSIMVEGESDFILLPSLLRQATKKDVLDYQIVPGIAEAGHKTLQGVNTESDVVFYLVDGDIGGSRNADKVARAGMQRRVIAQLPTDITLEELVSESMLRQATQEQLRRLGCHDSLPQFPNTGRGNALKNWCAERNINVPSKVEVANRILDIHASPDKTVPLIEDEYQEILRELDEVFMAAFAPDEN